jgi:hypothetical protein
MGIGFSSRSVQQLHFYLKPWQKLQATPAVYTLGAKYLVPQMRIKSLMMEAKSVSEASVFLRWLSWLSAWWTFVDVFHVEASRFFIEFIYEIIVQEVPVQICSVVFTSCHLCWVPGIFAFNWWSSLCTKKRHFRDNFVIFVCVSLSDYALVFKYVAKQEGLLG